MGRSKLALPMKAVTQAQCAQALDLLAAIHQIQRIAQRAGKDQRGRGETDWDPLHDYYTDAYVADLKDVVQARTEIPRLADDVAAAPLTETQ